MPDTTMRPPFALKTPFLSGTSPHPDATRSLWFIYAKTRLLVNKSVAGKVSVCSRSPLELGMQPAFVRYLGRYGGANCFVATLAREPEAGEGWEFRDLRSLFGALDDDLFCLAGRAIQILHWHSEHRFCGKCATQMVDEQSELARKCPNCHFTSYPRLSPAVIMSVIRGDQILLARAPRFPAGMYSTLAGFVEPGETLEEAVMREVLEEVAVSVTDIRYVASQPWPFPHSLMVGFSAAYVSGEIQVNTEELEDARWFSVAELPALPSKISISRLLIDNFIQGCTHRPPPLSVLP